MIAAAVWLILLSAFWLAGQALLWALLFYLLFDFSAWRPTAWLQLYGGFLAGSSIRFDFVATIAGALSCAIAGEIALSLRLPSLISWLPPLPSIEIPLRLPRRPASRPPQPQRRSPTPPRIPAARPPLPAPPPAPPEPQAAAAPNGDSAAIARMLALLEVWNEPPAAWMKDAMLEETALVSAQGWSLLRDLGAAGLRLAVLLEAHGLLPDCALPDVDAVFAISPPETVEAAPSLTTGAAWLCELLDNFVPTTDGEPVEELLGRAMRGMSEEDWASLDRFPEKAGRVRVLTDQLADDRRRASKAVPAMLIDGLLQQFGFTIRRQGTSAPLIAERGDLSLLLMAIDLRQRRWSLPNGPLGSWIDQDGAAAHPGQVLWQHLTMLRLRRPGSVLGAMVAHDGSIEDVAGLKDSAVELVFLTETAGAVPSLRNYLGALRDNPVKIRPQATATQRAALQP